MGLLLHATTNGTAAVRCRKVTAASLNPHSLRVEHFFEWIAIGLISELSKPVEGVGWSGIRTGNVAVLCQPLRHWLVGVPRLVVAIRLLRTDAEP